MTLITVIMPVLNGMPYLTDALLSLENQTLQDFEVIVWDNGSTDGSIEEAKRWIPSRLQGRVVVDQPLPLHQCLAQMVKESQTEFIARMDADDISHPKRFEKQIARLMENEKICAVGGQLRRIDTNGVTIPGFPPYPEKFHEILSYLLYGSPMPHAATMFRRKSLLDCGNYQVPKPVEDLDLWFRLAKQGILENLNDAVYDYRIVTTGVTISSQQAGKHLDAVKSCLTANVPKLFDVSASSYVAMLSKTQRFSFIKLRRIAQSIAKLANVPLHEVVSSKDFLFSSRALTSRHDLISRFIFFWWGRDRSTSLLSQVLHKMGFLPGFRNLKSLIAKYRNQKKIKKWLRKESSRQNTIEQVDVRGRENWFEHVKLGENVTIEKEVTFAFVESDERSNDLVIGNRVFIGRNTFLSAVGGIRIHDDVLIGAYSYIASNNHNFETRSIRISEQGYTLAEVEIGTGAWLGAHVIILPGIKIGAGAIIGAGSVVTKDVPSNEVWAGVPAKYIKTRK